jgi:hypothetical protein
MAAASGRRELTTMLWRHGDVLIGAVPALPRGAKHHDGAILVHGEFTGHSHRIQDLASAQLYTHGNDLFLAVSAPTATIIHQEHAPITIPTGVYRVWQQREYTPGAIRRVAD